MPLHFGYNPPSGDRRLEPVNPETFRDDLDRVLGLVAPVFDSVWVSDHFMTGDRFRLEAWTLLTWIAGRHPELSLGTIVLSASYRHPPLLAKMAASLQHLMGGRLILGYGAGWAEDEYRAYGYEFPPARIRIEQLDEALTLLAKLWEGGPVDFDGRWYRLKGAICEPHPDPPPLVMVGGEGPRTMAVAARHAQWWNGLHRPASVLHQRQRQLDQACEEAGRDPATLRRSLYLTVFLSPDATVARRLAGARVSGEAPVFAGDPSEMIDHLGDLVGMGFDAFQLVFAGFPGVADVELFGERVLPAFRQVGLPADDQRGAAVCKLKSATPGQ